MTYRCPEKHHINADITAQNEISTVKTMSLHHHVKVVPGGTCQEKSHFENVTGPQVKKVLPDSAVLTVFLCTCFETCLLTFMSLHVVPVIVL